MQGTRLCPDNLVRIGGGYLPDDRPPDRPTRLKARRSGWTVTPLVFRYVLLLTPSITSRARSHNAHGYVHVRGRAMQIYHLKSPASTSARPFVVGTPSCMKPSVPRRRNTQWAMFSPHERSVWVPSMVMRRLVLIASVRTAAWYVLSRASLRGSRVCWSIIWQNWLRAFLTG